MVYFPEVNFTNILQAAFAPKLFLQKLQNPKLLLMKNFKKHLYTKRCL